MKHNRLRSFELRFYLLLQLKMAHLAAAAPAAPPAAASCSASLQPSHIAATASPLTVASTSVNTFTSFVNEKKNE